MKKLFTLCATALLTFTLSAQVEQGDFFVGSGNATDLLKLFSNDGIELTPTIGYAAQDDVVIFASSSNEMALSGESFDNIFSVGAYKFLDDNYTVGVEIMDVTEVLGDRSILLSAGKMITLDEISNSLYIWPMIVSDLDFNMNTGVAFGFRF